VQANLTLVSLAIIVLRDSYDNICIPVAVYIPCRGNAVTHVSTCLV